MFGTDIKNITDDEVPDRKSNLFKQSQKFKNMAKIIHELIESTNPVTEIEVDDVLSN